MEKRYIMKEIQSEKNSVIKDYLKIVKGKQESGEILLPLEGFHLIKSALTQGFEIKSFFYCDEVADNSLLEEIFSLISNEVNVFKITASVLNKITTAKTPQGVAALATYPLFNRLELLSNKDLRAVLVDRLQDPGNFGTIIRTAAAAGFDAVMYTPETVKVSNPKALRSTAGALFHIKVLAIDDTDSFIEEIRTQGIDLIAASPEAEQLYYNIEYKKPFIIMIGNENKGINNNLAEAASQKVSIPMKSEVESVNAAVAASIIIFEASKQNSGS